MKIFLSYNRKNQPFVKAIAQQLSQLGFKESIEVFFDEEDLTAGDNWVTAIDNALSQSDVCIVFIGEQGIGGWQNKEALKAVNRNVDSKGDYKIIPVILPYENKNLAKSFPWFLADYQWVEFNDANDQYAFDKLLVGIRDNKDATINTSGINPYKGLDYFEVNDAPFFFGRTFDLNWVFYKKLKLSSKNTTNNFLAIVGDSGSGKSSFARAGILASLQAGKYESSDQWPVIITKPGDRPLLNLSTSLQKEKVIPDSGSFDRNALESKDQLRRAVEVYGNRIILFIDQFEETLTQCKEEQERKAYLQNLTEANKSGKLIILLTLRSDYYASFSKYTEFADMLEANNYTLSGLDFSVKDDDWKKRIADIIEMPAKLSGVKVQPALTASIIKDIKGLQGTLPLLQMALSQIWKSKQQDAIMDSNNYAVVSGGMGIEGIIEKHADQVYETYTNKESDIKKGSLLKNIFIRLVELTAGKDDVRKTIQKTQLENDLTGVFSTQEIEDALVFLSGEDARLISVRTDENKLVWIQVVHEVLIRNWSKLKSWIDERREALFYKENIISAIEEYNSNNKAKEFLYSGIKLKKAKKWMYENPDLSTNKINEFINKPAQIQKGKRIQSGIAFLFIAIAAWIGYGLYNNYLFNHSALRTDLKSRNIDIDSVRYLDVYDKNDLKYLSEFKNLDSLFIHGSDTLQSLAGIEKLDKLTSLSLNFLPSLKDLSGIEKLDKLTSLSIDYLPSLKDLSGIEKLDKLTSLSLSSLPSLKDLSGIEKLGSLTSLTLAGLDSLKDLSGIEKLDKLTSLSLRILPSLKDLSGIEKLGSLTSLSLPSLPSLKDLSGIEKLGSLTSLTLAGLDSLKDLSGIEKLDKLTSLSLPSLPSLKDLSGIEKLDKLTSLSLYNLPSLKDLSGIEKLDKLTSLSLDYLPSLKDLSGIEKLGSLTSLSLDYLPSLKDLSGIEKLGSLTSLSLESLDSLKDLSGIEKLDKLTSLSLVYLPSLKDLSGIEKLDKLTSLSLVYLPSLKDLSGIEKLDKLTSLSLSSLSGLKDLASFIPVDLKKITAPEIILTDDVKQKINQRAPKCKMFY